MVIPSRWAISAISGSILAKMDWSSVRSFCAISFWPASHFWASAKTFC